MLGNSVGVVFQRGIPISKVIFQQLERLQLSPDAAIGRMISPDTEGNIKTFECIVSDNYLL